MSSTTDPAALQPAAGPRESRSDGFRLAFVFFCVVVILAGPLAVGRFRYHLTYNALKAEADVASEGLESLKPRLDDFVLASRLVAKRVSPSVVGIYRPGPRGPTGQGSGVIVDEAGFIVTNYHVVAGAQQLHVRLNDGRDREVEPIGGDPGTDLAVLKVDLPNLIAAKWGDSDELQVGDLVWALGSPFGLDRSITFGIVSAKGRGTSSGVTRYPYQEYLQTDAAVNPGNSGGPLVDLEGKVVGINTAIVGSSFRGVSFAIPSLLAREKYLQLRKDGWIARGYLGISPQDVPPAVQQQLGLAAGEGVYVGRVQQNHPADQAGLEVGDVILQWNDHLATDPTLLSRTIAATDVGSTAQVVVARPTSAEAPSAESFNRVELNVTVGRHPDF